MADNLAEMIKMQERKAYYASHCADKSFPLDGSDWARLLREKQILERHPHCRCDSCENLLTRLHDRNSLLKRQRIVVAKALHHWFLQEEKYGSLYWTMREQQTAHELAKALVDNSEDHPSTLIDAEKDWLSQKIYSKPDPSGLLTDEDAEKELDNFTHPKELAINESDFETNKTYDMIETTFSEPILIEDHEPSKTEQTEDSNSTVKRESNELEYTWEI